MNLKQVFSDLEKSRLLERYAGIRHQVRSQAASAWEEVIVLCSKIPHEISLQSFWEQGEDKPCYSNIKVDMGHRIAADLAKSNDFGSYQEIASDKWAIEMLRPGISWKSNSNFRITGDSVREFLGRLDPGGLSSYRWRLYAIRQLALTLTNNPDLVQLVSELGEKGDECDGAQLIVWAKRISNMVGMGWGYVTANHLLTDLGLSIKPDLHVRRAAVRMGLLAPQISEYMTNDEIDALSGAVDQQIVLRLKYLSKDVVPIATLNKRATLREMDKTLMEWSRQGLSHPLR